MLIQQFCPEYNRNVTRSLQDLETEVQNLLVCTGDQGQIEALQSKKAALASLLGITTQGALVRSRYMDVPSSFFFGLEKKNGQRKLIHSLRSADGSAVTETADTRRYATRFYTDLFKTELVEDPGSLESAFLADLPTAELTLEELHVALLSLANGKAPGIDGIPVEFYTVFWTLLGEDMLNVFKESFKTGLLPQSCRRAVITLLPKKGDLQELKNWRLVSLLCADYEILSKSLAMRLREVMVEVVDPDQTYCVPDRLISDNITLIRHVFDVSGLLAVATGLISIDQEKALDRVEHRYLWNTLEK